MAGVEKLLEDIAALTDTIRRDENSPEIRKIGVRLAQQWFSLKEEQGVCLDFFDREFVLDPELHILVLSVLFFLFKDKELLNRAERALQNDALSYDMAVGVRQQISAARFQQKEPGSYRNRRICQKYLVERLKRELGNSFPRIPYEERNHQRIIIATDTLLSDRHAPTMFVLETAKILQEEFGYEIMVLVNVEKADVFQLEKYWLYPYHFHYQSYVGAFEREYRGTRIRGFQQIVDREHFPQTRQMLQMVWDWNPEFVWVIGGDSVVNDLLGNITDLVASSCTREYAVSEAQILASFDKTDLNFAEMKRYAPQRGQKIVDIGVSFLWNGSRPEAGKECVLSVPQNRFLIAVCGNRLEEEIDAGFKNMMRDIVSLEKSCHFLLIGRYDPEFDEDLREHVSKLGYREDFINVLGKANLFLNPVRTGGGWSAVMALSVGVPVVTLPECDVAVNVGERFICSRKEDIIPLIRRYIHDEDFRKSQIRECEKQYHDLFAVDKQKEIGKLIQAVRELH